MPVWRFGKAGITWPETWKVSAAGAHSRRPAQGLQVHFGRAPFSSLCAGRPAGALPAGDAVLARRARPSLRQWVWTRVGEEGEGRLCLLPLPPPLFSPPSARCHLFAVCHVFTVPCQAVRLRFGAQGGVVSKGVGWGAIGAEILAFCCYRVEPWERPPRIFPRIHCFVCRANVICDASLAFCLVFYKGV